MEKSFRLYGRVIDPVDEMLLEIAAGDAELHLNGGDAQTAYRAYNSVVTRSEDTTEIPCDAWKILVAYCLKGLTKIAMYYPNALLESSTQSSLISAESYARRGVALVQNNIVIIDCLEKSKRYLSFTVTNLYNHLQSQLRQLVAETMMEKGEIDAAISYLLEAIADNANDVDANCALASMQLKRFVSSPGSIESKNLQKLLLKAAKLDSSRADSFSLLGYWFEFTEDKKRAVGCYEKALKLNPCEPIAGRGICRLLSYSEAKRHCTNAVGKCSSLLGWAWTYLGRGAVNENEDDSVAVACFQEALRMNDIDTNLKSTLSFFYSNPQSPGIVFPDKSNTWCKLADCYYHLGKYSAAVRAYNAAAESSDGNLNSEVLCKWAQGTFHVFVNHCDFENVLRLSLSTLNIKQLRQN